MRSCSHCAQVIDSALAIGYASLCPNCSKHLHSCVNCRFYAPGSYHDCAERVEEFIADKEAPNYCDYFVLGSNTTTKEKKENARAKAEALFNF